MNLAVALVLAGTVGLCGCVGVTGAPSGGPPGLQLSANPSNVDFGNVAVGSTVAQSIALMNSGSVNLTISGAVVSGTGFSMSGLSTPLTLAPGQGTSFTAQFTPQVAGSVTGGVSLVSDTLGASPFTTPFAPQAAGSGSLLNRSSPKNIPLAGRGTDNPTLGLSLSPASIAFGSVTVGNSSTQTATLTNIGSGTVVVSQASASGAGFSLNGLSLPLTLPRGQSANFLVIFAPAAAGNSSGGITITSNASNSPATNTLSGTGVQPPTGQLTANPTSIDFGQVLLGSNSTRTVTLTNTGSASVTISQASASGSGFSASGLSTPLTLTPGQSTNFTARFAPQAAGSVTGSVSVVSSASNSPTSIALAGSGLATTLLLTADPTSLVFGDIAIGSNGTRTVMLTNAGNSSLTISQINVSGAAFSTNGLTPPMTLTAGQTTAFTVVFAPSTSGSVNGTVTVTSSATNSPATISLSGNGVPPVAHSVALAWDPSTSVVAGYNVYRGTVSGGPYTKLNSSLVQGTTYTDSTVQTGRTYFYVVTAVDSSGLESDYSNESPATIP